MEEEKRLLSDTNEDVLDQWKKQPCIVELQKTDLERWERSKQFVVFMKEFERLLRRKLIQIRTCKTESVELLDTEFLICIYNLFLTISN
jgi:hypothetical protein